jgi:hypothetical protein
LVVDNHGGHPSLLPSRLGLEAGHRLNDDFVKFLSLSFQVYRFTSRVVSESGQSACAPDVCDCLCGRSKPAPRTSKLSFNTPGKRLLSTSAG